MHREHRMNGMEWNGVEWSGMECNKNGIYYFYDIYTNRMKWNARLNRI